MVLMDMIGFRPKDTETFQINLGDGWEDQQIGSLALAAAKKYAPRWKPELRTRFDAKNYLYNTDGYIYDNLGYPVVFFNEPITRFNKGDGNPHYHQSTENSAVLDYDYANDIGKAAIATALHLANTSTAAKGP